MHKYRSMIKQFLITGFCLQCSVLLISCSKGSGSGQAGNTVPVSQTSYQELADPVPVDQASWQDLESGSYVAFASPDVRYPKRNAPSISPSDTTWQTTAWKGEKVHTQFLIWTTEALEKVSMDWGSLQDGRGNEIPAGHVRASFVRYVMADGEKSITGKCQIQPYADSTLVADVIDDLTQYLPVEGRTTRPVWLSVRVPEDIPAGTYQGAVTVKDENRGELATLTYAVKVTGRTLPPPEDWAFHLDLWQSPDAVARMHKVEKWSDEHMEVMKPYMEMLADAGQKVITATLIHDPWNSQTYDVYSSMIKWTRKKDGSWEYDYTIFDKWVSYMMDLGIDGLIECYSMIPWNLKFYYYDEALGKDTLIVAEPESPEYKAHWQPMLDDFAAHLKEKGWFGKTTIAMDERPMEAMQKAIAVIKSADPDFKISLAGNYHPEIEDQLYDYCVASHQTIDEGVMRKRREEGLITTYYTCCVEAYPNTFTLSPPAESAWLAWHAAKKGYDGYLRWAYNSWPENPLQDSRFGKWTSGDTYFVYPGHRSSIRFERLVEGIEDYEKIRILKEVFEKNGRQDKLEALEEAVSAFDLEALKTIPAAEMLHKAKNALTTLSAPETSSAAGI